VFVEEHFLLVFGSAAAVHDGATEPLLFVWWEQEIGSFLLVSVGPLPVRKSLSISRPDVTVERDPKV